MIHVVELKKLKDASETEQEQPLYHWARLIAATDWETVCEEASGNEYMEAARDIMAKMNENERERYLYLRREMAYTDEISRMRTARAEGKAEGKTEGIMENQIRMIQKKIRKNKSLEQIAEEMEENVEDIRALFEIVQENMDETAEEIMEKMTSSSAG